MTAYTIYHNPACSTSRQVLAALREAGHEPTVIEYLKHPPSRATLEELAAALGGVRALLRTKAPPYAELGLADAKWSDAQLLDFMEQHPVLLERPIVVTPEQTIMARPAASVQRLLHTA